MTIISVFLISHEATYTRTGTGRYVDWAVSNAEGPASLIWTVRCAPALKETLILR